MNHPKGTADHNCPPAVIGVKRLERKRIDKANMNPTKVTFLASPITVQSFQGEVHFEYLKNFQSEKGNISQHTNGANLRKI